MLIDVSVPLLLSVIVGTVSWYPIIGVYFGNLLRQSLPWMALASIAMAIVMATVINNLRSPTENTKIEVLPSLSKGYTRRQAMIAILGTALVVLLIAAVSPLRQASRQGNSRRNNKNGLSLEQGFYRNSNPITKDWETRTHVIHYVGPKGHTSSRGRVPMTLVKTTPPPYFLNRHQEVPCEDDPIKGFGAMEFESLAVKPAEMRCPLPRVHLAAASWSFEEAALHILRQGSIGTKRAREVCQLLLCGIQHDILYKQHYGKIGRPSFRLYDLLTGVSVRYRQEEYSKQMLRLIEGSELQLLFQIRIEKWQNPAGSWRQKWKNHKKLITWKSASGAVVF
jgi:hypothetical protein